MPTWTSPTFYEGATLTSPTCPSYFSYLTISPSNSYNLNLFLNFIWSLFLLYFFSPSIPKFSLCSPLLIYSLPFNYCHIDTTSYTFSSRRSLISIIESWWNKIVIQICPPLLQFFANITCYTNILKERYIKILIS